MTPRYKRVCNHLIGASLIVTSFPLASCSSNAPLPAPQKPPPVVKDSAPVTMKKSADNSANKFFKEAQNSVGNQMWHGYGLKNGYYGCAAAVCNVLKNAGHGGGDSAAVAVMRKQLLKSRGAQEFVVKEGGYDAIDNKRLIALAQPGDVLVAFLEKPDLPNTGPNAHCGIMGSGTKVYTNDWNDGVWKEGDIHHFFDSYKFIRLIRLPE